MQLFFPGVVGASALPAITTYKRIEKSGGEDAQLLKVAQDKTIHKNIEYIQKTIADADKPEDLFKDRKVMQFILSAFSLDTELDKSMGIIKKVLTEDPSKSSSLANRLADPRYAQMAKSLNFFANGLSKLKETTASQSDYNLSLTGNNYFVMQETTKSGDLVNRYAQSFAFSEDSKGYLSGPGGLPLQGWALDTNGKISAKTDSLGNYSTSGLSALKVNMLDNASSPTKAVTVDTNLKSTIDGSALGPHYIEDVKIFDTSGTARNVQLQYTKRDTNDGSNKWNLKIYDAAKTDGTPLNGSDGTEVSFNADGSLNDMDATTAGTQRKLELKNVNFFGNFGASNISFDLSQLRSTTTDSYSIPAKIDSVKLGKHTKLNIAADGIVTATYSGGQKLALFQIATARFDNPSSLIAAPGNKSLLSASGRTGEPTVTVPGAGGQAINNSVPAAKKDTLFETLSKSYYRNEYETAIGNEKGALRSALYFKRNAGNVKSIYNVLGDKVLRDVVAKAFQIPDQVATQGVETQARVFERRIDVKKFSDPKFIDKIINQYLSQADAADTGLGGSTNWKANLLNGGGGLDLSLVGRNYSTLV